jgi:RimJ/RimL family protein N-acetyltransferase
MPTLPSSLRLEGDGIALRDWRPEDAPALEPVCGEWDVCAFTSVPWDYGEAAARAWVERQRAKREAGTVLALAIELPGRELPVGNVNLGGFDDERRQAELGYWLVPEARGRGLVTTAARAIVDHGFETLGLERIELAILPRNRPSHSVAARLGARPEGIRAAAHRDSEGRDWDIAIYALEPPRP